MSNVFFLGDLHLGHTNIHKFREEYSFATREKHDEAVLESIERTCNPKRDTLYLMGDVYFNREGYKFAERLSASVAHLHLILGNHDFGNGSNQGQLIMRELLEKKYIKTIRSLYKYKDVWLSHAPIHPVELRGSKNIHGHVHNKTLDDDNYFNLSLENTIDFAPVSFESILNRTGLKR
jgi:calcineurin-like phosphoesterase family protein